MTKTTKTYKQMRDELDKLLEWFDQEDLDIDKAIEKYKLAVGLAKKLEEYLESAKNTIKKLT